MYRTEWSTNRQPPATAGKVQLLYVYSRIQVIGSSIYVQSRSSDVETTAVCDSTWRPIGFPPRDAHLPYLVCSVACTFTDFHMNLSHSAAATFSLEFGHAEHIKKFPVEEF